MIGRSLFLQHCVYIPLKNRISQVHGQSCAGLAGQQSDTRPEAGLQQLVRTVEALTQTQQQNQEVSDAQPASGQIFALSSGACALVLQSWDTCIQRSAALSKPDSLLCPWPIYFANCLIGR